jgi:hypothetical protein
MLPDFVPQLSSQSSERSGAVRKSQILIGIAAQVEELFRNRNRKLNSRIWELHFPDSKPEQGLSLRQPDPRLAPATKQRRR